MESLTNIVRLFHRNLSKNSHFKYLRYNKSIVVYVLSINNSLTTVMFNILLPPSYKELNNENHKNIFP